MSGSARVKLLRIDLVHYNATQIKIQVHNEYKTIIILYTFAIYYIEFPKRYIIFTSRTCCLILKEWRRFVFALCMIFWCHVIKLMW